jgi:hypothetical protein
MLRLSLFRSCHFSRVAGGVVRTTARGRAREARPRRANRLEVDKPTYPGVRLVLEKLLQIHPRERETGMQPAGENYSCHMRTLRSATPADATQ